MSVKQGIYCFYISYEDNEGDTTTTDPQLVQGTMPEVLRYIIEEIKDRGEEIQPIKELSVENIVVDPTEIIDAREALARKRNAGGKVKKVLLPPKA